MFMAMLPMATRAAAATKTAPIPRTLQQAKQAELLQLVPNFFPSSTGVDPSVPDPFHPGLSTDYRKPGSAAFGVAAQSRFTHPEHIPGVKKSLKSNGGGGGGSSSHGSSTGVDQDWRVESSSARIARTEAAVVKMPSGLEAFEPKLFHRCCVSMCFLHFCFSSVC